jgi:S-adenosylmethionine hydrolase
MEMAVMKPLVFQTDFGLVDGAVSAMYGVAYTVDPSLRIHDLTHDITPYNIWEASYRLIQTINYWPEGTVFVSVVDPGVGSDRKSIVVKTKSGRYIVTPDNGTLTHVLRAEGLCSAREIDEQINRLPRSGESYTFHGRDVYAYTGARLASGVIDFEGVGPEIPVEELMLLPVVEPYLSENAVTVLSMCWMFASAAFGLISPALCFWKPAFSTVIGLVLPLKTIPDVFTATSFSMPRALQMCM